MPKQNDKIFTERQIALDKYINERDKMSSDLYKIMSKHSRHDNLIEGVFGGLVMGIVIALLFGSSTGRVPTYDKNGHVVEYKLDKKHMAKASLQIITLAILAGLVVTGVENLNTSRRNRGWSNDLAVDIMKSYFDKPLENYRDSYEFPLRSVCAAALIVNNLPDAELHRLRALAKSGITRNENGFYNIDKTCVSAASEIISNFISYNPELSYNVLRIMRGQEPTTYFLPSLMNQKTK